MVWSCYLWALSMYGILSMLQGITDDYKSQSEVAFFIIF